MTIKTLWIIIIKLFGIYLIISSITVLPHVLLSINYLFSDDIQGVITLFIAFSLILITYILIMRIFIFRPTWLIEKLKLENGFEEVRIDIYLSKTNAVRIASIILGGYLFIESFPLFIKQLFIFFQEEPLSGRFGDKPSTHFLLFNAFKALMGYLIVVNFNSFSKYIENLGDKSD